MTASSLTFLTSDAERTRRHAALRAAMADAGFITDQQAKANIARPAFAVKPAGAGTINYVAETGKVQKCDLCGGNPACVAACPTGAITYVDADWTGLERMKLWAAKVGSQPHA